MELPGLDEPVGLRDRAAGEPDAVKAQIASGRFISTPLWKAWGPVLSDHGVDRQALTEVLRGYGYELWLWAVGQRSWEQCLDGLTGRVSRRVGAGTRRRGADHERPPAGRTTGTAPSGRAKKATTARRASPRATSTSGSTARKTTKAARGAKSGKTTRAAPAKSGRTTRATKATPAGRSTKRTRRR